eukprot:333161-Prymnesium_polylepis.1
MKRLEVSGGAGPGRADTPTRVAGRGVFCTIGRCRDRRSSAVRPTPGHRSRACTWLTRKPPSPRKSNQCVQRDALTNASCQPSFL